MNHFAFPFQFKNCRVNSLDPTSDQFAAQCIASVWQTRLEELPIFPWFGTSDPLFNRLDYAGFYSTMSQYFPGIRINGFLESVSGDGQIIAEVDFTLETSTVTG